VTDVSVFKDAANDNDPFVGAFEKAAGTEKRPPSGEPFGQPPQPRD
jgi:hypothetical protein